MLNVSARVSRLRGCIHALLALLAVTPAFGHALTGAIEGRVLNATSGSYLNNVRVAVNNTPYEAVTKEDGEFRLAGLPAGVFTVTVRTPGSTAGRSRPTSGWGAFAGVHSRRGRRHGGSGAAFRGYQRS